MGGYCIPREGFKGAEMSACFLTSPILFCFLLYLSKDLLLCRVRQKEKPQKLPSSVRQRHLFLSGVICALM